MSFGKRLKLLREQKNLSQRDLAKILNMAPSTLAMYEVDKREPDFSTIKKLADFFNVTTDYLLGRTDICNANKADEDANIDDQLQPKELEKILKEANIMFDGTPLDENDREDILDFLRIAMRTIKKRKQHGEKTTDDNHH